MKTRKLFILVIINLIVLNGALFSTTAYSNIKAGGTISGFIFDLQRQPISNVTVELLNEFSQEIARTRTDSAGQYIFNGLTSGKFKIGILLFGLNLEEQEQDFQIESSNEIIQKDFYLNPRKENPLNPPEAIFVQEIPLPAKEIFKKAVKELYQQNTEQGFNYLKSVIELYPDYYEAIELLGTECVKLKNYDSAEILLRRAVEINPRGYKSWYGLAYALFSQNKTKEALEAAEKAIQYNQFSAEPPFLAGVLLKYAGRFEESEKQLKRAAELSKNRISQVHWQLALLYCNNLKRYNDAANELEFFLKTSPKNKNDESVKNLISRLKEKTKK